MTQEIAVRLIATTETLPLRSLVLRPGRAPEIAIFAGDEDPETVHLGAFVLGELVGVASLFNGTFPDEERGNEKGRHDWQLRGMAVEPSQQKRGVGKALVHVCIEFVAQQDQALVWCNARVTAVEFYRLADFEALGDEFVIPDIGPHFIMVHRG